MLIQVSPVERGGVLDYLQCLSAQWASHGTPSHAVPMSKSLAQERSLDDRVADCCLQSGRPAHGSPCSIVLHFSGYGYGQRGLCFWLLRELEILKQARRGSVHLVIVFHELFAKGPPWRSAFWVSGAQAWIAGRAARLADVVWTNTESHANWLRGATRNGTPLHARPVFSNVGEPAINPALSARRASAVVFGSAPTRQRAINGLKGMASALRALGVEELIEAGSGGPSQNPPTALPCRYVGQLAPDELGVLLRSSRFGLLDYESHGLAKSGVFAAYAAHGCVVLNTSPHLSDSDNLQADRDYLALASPAAADLTLAALQARATRLDRWYQGHRLDQQARELLVLAGSAS